MRNEVSYKCDRFCGNAKLFLLDPPAPAASPAGSWLSWIWKRSDTPGPIKASLGEETSFYYDKELKRWVNKKVNKLLRA